MQCCGYMNETWNESTHSNDSFIILYGLRICLWTNAPRASMVWNWDVSLPVFFFILDLLTIRILIDMTLFGPTFCYLFAQNCRYLRFTVALLSLKMVIRTSNFHLDEPLLICCNDFSKTIIPGKKRKNALFLGKIPNVPLLKIWNFGCRLFGHLGLFWSSWGFQQFGQ